MDVYYKINGVRSTSSAGTECYDERIFFVEKTYDEYVNAAQLVDRFQTPSREYFDSTWWVDPVRKKLFTEIGERVREDDFPEWYLKACSVCGGIANWNLKSINGYADIVRVDVFKHLAIDFVMTGRA